MSDYCIENPILPGFYPDPSICRLGEDFYLVCSSFSYYPGVPIFHSRDLAHWESLGYVLDDPATLRLSPDRISGGIFAPTIRVHDGKFYVIVGNTSTGETLLALTGDPAGRWEVHTIEGPGGDPSLFWDEDGTCWCSYSAMGFGSGAHGIVHRQLNLDTFQLEGEEHFLWGGASVGAWSPEASHMYYRDGWYYLMISEGGTEHYHAVCVARSRDIHGPYTNYRGNPILTHRHLSMHYPICNIGHADIVDTPNGDWYMVALGSRIYGGYHKNLGRETYICPMVWESGWPIAAPDTGKVEWRYPAPAGLPSYPAAQLPARDDFDAPALSWQWNYLGTPKNAPARLEGGELFIRALPEAVTREPQRRAMPDFSKLSEEEVQALRAAMRGSRNIDARALGFVGRRQQHPSYTATAKMTFRAADAREAAGLIDPAERLQPAAHRADAAGRRAGRAGGAARAGGSQRAHRRHPAGDSHPGGARRDRAGRPALERGQPRPTYRGQRAVQHLLRRCGRESPDSRGPERGRQLYGQRDRGRLRGRVYRHVRHRQRRGHRR